MLVQRVCVIAVSWVLVTSCGGGAKEDPLSTMRQQLDALYTSIDQTAQRTCRADNECAAVVLPSDLCGFNVVVYSTTATNTAALLSLTTQYESLIASYRDAVYARELYGCGGLGPPEPLPACRANTCIDATSTP